MCMPTWHHHAPLLRIACTIIPLECGSRRCITGSDGSPQWVDIRVNMGKRVVRTGPGLPPVALVGASEGGEGPKKKRRTLRDAEQELEDCRSVLKEAKRKLIVTARENAKMKVLLMKYIEKDDSLISTSQLSESNSQQHVVASDASNAPSYAPSTATSFTGTQSTVFSSGLDEEESESSLWTSDFSAEMDGPDSGETTFGPVSQLSQISQLSQWSELSSTSNLDDIITFLEKQDVQENERVATMEAEFKELKAAQAVVRVGVGVILTSKQHPGCVLVGKRKGSHGAGKLALPGGHLEMYETWAECAVRELKEETDLNLEEDELKFAYVTNDPMENEGKHYITIFLQATVSEGHVPRNMEPNKCEGWEWVSWESLRTNEKLFVPMLHITRSGFTPV